MKITLPVTPFPPSVIEYFSGVPVLEVASRYGVTPKTIRKRARLMGVPPRKAKVTGKRLRQVIALYRRGWTWAQICEAMDIDRTTLGDVLRRKGVRMRQPRRGKT